MQVDRVALISICQQFGPLLHVPDGLDGVKVLWALAGNESDFGTNCSPRHESGYCPISKGHYAAAIAGLTRQFGCLAHCSFGAWQVMLCNCPGFTPLELLQDLDKQVQATVGFLNRAIFDGQGARSLAEIGDAFNAGNFRDLKIRAAALGVPLATLEGNPFEMAKMADAAYMDKLVKNYAVEMG